MATQSCIGLLERERRRQGMTGTALAEKMGVSRSSVSEVERGIRSPNRAFKEQAAKALKVPVERLFPAWYLLQSRAPSGIRLICDSSGKVAAFTEKSRAEAVAGEDTEVVGPAGPDLFALLLGVGEEQVEFVLHVDPGAGELSAACGSER